MAASPTGLALDAAGAVAAGQLLDLSHGDVVVVAADGVLQSGSSNGELDGFLAGLAGQQGVDQTAAEGGLEGGSLNETLVVEGLQTQHQLAESDNLCHDQNLSCYKFF